jgi:ribosomal protein S18 acetylase RimI-like enzyme
MQELAVEQRRMLGERAPWHPGDIVWSLRDAAEVRVWEEGGKVVAWSWLDDGSLELDVRHDRRDLLDEILSEPEASGVWAFEDDGDYRAALARHGFTRPGRAFHFNVRDVPEAPAQAPLPDGFRLRTVEPDDLAERVAVHRDVWAPSRLTEPGYRTVMASWPYRACLDCVVEAPDGRFAAYVLVWPDDENGVALFEPVGTRAELRRRGLGAAVCTFALRRLHEEGMRQAIVLCETDEACGLYAAVGFRRTATNVLYAR